MQIKKSKNPIATLGFEINNLSLKKKNPRNIRTRGKRKYDIPKYLWIKSDRTARDGWLSVNERKIKRPEIIRPKEKIE